MIVHKDPNCGCCEAWVEHVRANGFAVEVRDTDAINRVKGRLGVPRSLVSCHTAEFDGYVIEGHVPAAEIRRLLAERPRSTGLAVAGMPAGSPGMEMPDGSADRYSVVLFGPGGQSSTYATYRGPKRL
jgi:hypothetical protein